MGSCSARVVFESSEAGLAGFEPATHGPGNRCDESMISTIPYFYAVYPSSLVHNTTQIGCHKLSIQLSTQHLISNCEGNSPYHSLYPSMD
jgi:hypothetical protein